MRNLSRQSFYYFSAQSFTIKVRKKENEVVKMEKDDGTSLGIGLALGLIFGMLFDNLAIGLALGVALGASGAFATRKKNQK